MPTDDSQHFENKNIYFYQNNRKDFFIAYHGNVIEVRYGFYMFLIYNIASF